MGITKISNLFAANIDGVPAVKPTSPIASETRGSQETSQAASDAVVFSKSLPNAAHATVTDSESARAARVQKIKEQVRSGEYKANKEGVAISILRDLA